jgi:hypothetical protein
MLDIIITLYLFAVPPKQVHEVRQCVDFISTPVLIRSIRTRDKIVNMYGVRCTTA